MDLALDDVPEIDENDPVQIWLRHHWNMARIDRDSERAKGPRAFNTGAIIAGHKMAWLKELIRERRGSHR